MNRQELRLAAAHSHRVQIKLLNRRRIVKPFDLHTTDRFLSVKPELVRVIEEHLRGDFSDWEERHTRWDGKQKTVDANEYDPRSEACAWGLFVKSDFGAEFIGPPKKARNLNALDELEKTLTKALKKAEALPSYSGFALLRANTEHRRTIGGMVARMGLVLAIEDTLESIPAAKRAIEEYGAAYQHKVEAASVVAECREVWTARTGKPAPKAARDQGQKRSDTNKPAPFTQFAQDVFSVLGVRGSVAGALDAWRQIQELHENSGETSE